jgi:hypothetical protein
MPQQRLTQPLPAWLDAATATYHEGRPFRRRLKQLALGAVTRPAADLDVRPEVEPHWMILGRQKTGKGADIRHISRI